jgi:hypothetical protein
MKQPTQLKKASDETSPVETPATPRECCGSGKCPEVADESVSINAHPLSARQFVAVEIYKTVMMARPTMADAYNPGLARFAYQSADALLGYDKTNPVKES